MVDDSLRQQCVRVNDNSEGDEFLIIRLEHVSPPLNVINLYGMQEGKEGEEGKRKVLESWVRLQKELLLIEARNEAVAVLGDFNRAVGSDDLGVPGNKDGVSHGGGMIRDLLREGEYVLVNRLSLAVGGPWTRVDPTTGGLSCLDLTLVSVGLLPFIRGFVIDSEKSFTPRRVVCKKGKFGFCYSDHFSQELELVMPSSRMKNIQETGWNVYKPGGWEAYKEATKRKSKDVADIVENKELSEEDVMKKVDMIENKIKREVFGKTKIKKQRKTENKAVTSAVKNDETVEAKELGLKQLEKLEAQINKITSSSCNRCGQIYKVKELIEGPKKSGQESQAIKDPKTGELVVSTSEIKKITLEHCLNVLKNNEPAEDVEEIVKTKNKAVEEIMKSNDGEFVVSEESFEEVMSDLERKNKRSYDFIVKADKSYKIAIFGLCKRILEKEEIPLRFYLTMLVQLFKSRGSPQELTNFRYLHLKHYLPRVCESLVVNEMKDDIVEATSKFQCGGVPRMRPQFHLYVIKSTMAVASQSKEGRIFTLTDLVKFYDKEMLNDVILSLHGSVDRKALRLWWKLNLSTVITVKTGLGKTEAGEAGAVLGQGSKGSGLGSMRNLDRAVEDYFSGSEDEDVIGGVRLQPLIWVDDLLRSCQGVQEVRNGNQKLAMMVKEMCLEIHPTKSSYIVIGNQRFKEDVEDETRNDPIMFGEIELKREKCVTYLGDELHEDGLSASIEATILSRRGKVRGAVFGLVALWGDYRAQVVGGVLGAIALYEACIVSSLLNNSSTWLGITENQYNMLDAYQYEFLRALLQLPVSAPKACLRAATGVLGMKWRVWQEKLLLILAIKDQYEGVLVKQVFEDQVCLELPGLNQEAKEICLAIGLPNICKVNVTKKEVQENIFYHHMKCLKEELRRLEVKGAELYNADITKPQKYFETSSLVMARMAFRVQNRMLDIPADMPGRYLGRMQCTGCQGWEERDDQEQEQEECGPPLMTREHIEDCPGFAFLKAGKELIDKKEQSQFFIEVMRFRSMK